MSKLWAVIRREYVENVRTKAFILSTILVPVLMSASIFLPQFLAKTSTAKKLRVGVVDRAGNLFDRLDRELTTDKEKDFLPDGARRFGLTQATPDQAALLESETPGRILAAMGVDAVIEVTPGVLDGTAEPTYLSGNVGDFDPIRRLENALSTVVIGLRLADASLPADQVRSLTRRVDLQTKKVGKDGRAGKREFMQEYLTAILFVIGFYSSTIIAGMALSRGLLEEKGNRVVEVLISSVTPFQLMTGKILGHALVILSQMAIWMLMGAAFVTRGARDTQLPALLSSLSPWFPLYLAVYFLLGYFLYAAMFAGVGAVCTTEMEAQQTQTPLVLLQILPMVVAIAIVREPAGTLSVTLSMIPFFTSSVMMMRMVLAPPSAMEVAASVVILAGSVAAAFWAVSKVFRVGILMTGKKMTLGEMVRWIRAS